MTDDLFLISANPDYILNINFAFWMYGELKEVQNELSKNGLNAVDTFRVYLIMKRVQIFLKGIEYLREKCDYESRLKGNMVSMEEFAYKRMAILNGDDGHWKDRAWELRSLIEVYSLLFKSKKLTCEKDSDTQCDLSCNVEEQFFALQEEPCPEYSIFFDREEWDELTEDIYILSCPEPYISPNLVPGEPRQVVITEISRLMEIFRDKLQTYQKEKL